MQNKFILSILLLSTLNISAFAVDEFKTNNGGLWSESGTWAIKPSGTTDLYPNSNTVAVVGDNTNGGTLTVDGNYTAQSFFTGWEAKKFTLDISESSNSLTLDVAKESSSTAIKMWSGGTRAIDDNLTFKGAGTLNITNTTNLGNSTAVINMWQNNVTAFNKIINFESKVVSTEHLKFYGFNKSNQIINISGGFEMKNGSDYKNITSENVSVNFGSKSQIGSLGLLNSNFTILKDSSLTLSPTTPLQTSNTNYSLMINASSVLTVNGALNIKTIASTDCMRQSGKIIVGSTGSINISGTGWNNWNMYDNAILDISSSAGSIYIPSELRMAKNSTIILRSSNAISNNATGDSTVRFFATSSSSNHRIELYANNYISSFSFALNSTLTIYLDDACSELVIGTLSSKYGEGGWVGKLVDKDATIVFENFRNNVVKIVNIDDLTIQDLEHIKADGFTDFDITEDGYLIATAIPEPATIALILGALSLFLIVRSKK